LIELCCQQFGASGIGIGCPTGKAAVRMTEALQGYGLPLRAKTWHSLLGIGQADAESGNWEFKHHEGNPFPFKVLIGDESSMLDTNLMTSVFRARAAGTLFLLVGDVNQLPPVGHGAPLRDLIAAGLPYGELREIKRNSGGIVEACAAIRDGKRWGAGDNLQIFEHLEPESQVKRLVQLLQAAKDDGFDPIWHCQVVVAVNAKSKLSRKEINRILQAELNKNPEIKGSPFRLGDKIVNGKNGFFPVFDVDDLQSGESDEIQTNDREEVYVANGELAEVIDVAEKLVVAKLSNPTRTIKIPRGRSQDSDGSQDDATGSDSDKTSTGCSWDLGYALSVHKSQGSEWPIVFVMIDEYPGARMICTKEWLYTAISRAKQRCCLIGRKATADRFCRTTAIQKRKTFLAQLIALKSAERTLVEL
jgi:exodeoxyribonuclease V alpha subunit